MMIVKKIAHELQVQAQQVQAAVKLLDEGSTVPFIARYRKELTNSLDEVKIAEIKSLREDLTELETADLKGKIAVTVLGERRAALMNVDLVKNIQKMVLLIKNQHCRFG